MTIFRLTKDVNGINGFGVKFSTDMVNTTLVSGVEQHFTIPSDHAKWLIIFAFDPGSTVWVANNFTAALPGVSFASTTSEMNPNAREVKAGDIISMITADATVQVGVIIYALQS